MSFNFFAEQVPHPLTDYTEVEQWLSSVAADNLKSIGDINYIFCSDEYLLDINRQYLQHDFYTDVITFDYSEEEIIAGDIFISTERVQDFAKKEKIEIHHELYRVMVHGLLHLCGLNDKTEQEQEQMTQSEDHYLKNIL